jgi:hypothetical protein
LEDSSVERKGALIGTGVGAGAGGAVVMSTRGKEVRFGKGTLVHGPAPKAADDQSCRAHKTALEFN